MSPPQAHDPETGRFVATPGRLKRETYLLAWIAATATIGGLVGGLFGAAIGWPLTSLLRAHGYL